MFTIRLLIAFTFGLAVIIAESYWVYTCGPGYDYERFRISYVDPDLLSDSIYRSFYQTLLQDHQAGDNYWDSPREEFRGAGWTQIRVEENVKDWSRYFNNEVSSNSIYDLVYRSDTSTLNDALDSLEQGVSYPATDEIAIPEHEWQDPDTLHLRSAFSVINSRQDVRLLQYLLYAKRCSPHATTGDEWNPVEADLPAMTKLIEEGLHLHNTTLSHFLKLRYGFQLVRLARYAGQYNQAESFYRQLVVPNNTQSPMRYWALGHVAGAVRLAGDRPRSNYLFSHVFDSSEGNREIALRDFKATKGKDWATVYAMAQSDHERTRLWFMRGLKNRHLDFSYIEQMYKLTPASPQLAMALLRELHRIESFLYDDMTTRDLTVKKTGTFKYSIYNSDADKWIENRSNVANYGRMDVTRHISKQNNWDTLYYYDHETDSESTLLKVLSGRQYVQSFRRFVLTVAKNGDVLEPALWYMVAGYIDMMDGDYALADECLEEAKENLRGNYDLQHQIKLLDYLREARSKGEITPDIEGLLTESLRWMRKKQGQNRHTKYNKVMAALGQQYLAQSNVPKAILAFSAANDDVARNMLLDMYATTDELRDLEKVVDSRKGATPIMLDSFRLTPHELRDIRATRLMREEKFREAHALFASIPDAYWNDSERQGRTPCFLFATNNAVIDTNLPSIVQQGNVESSVSMNKKQFAETIVGLLDKAESSDNNDSAYLQVANLLYNTPFWGYSGTTWDGGLLVIMRYFHFGPTSYPFNIPRVAERMEEAEKHFMERYGARSQARKYYKKVMRQTKDRELAAHCAYMIDLCDKQPQTSLHSRTTPKTQQREGYELLITKYRDTRYAQAVLSQCSVYGYFVK